jgi:hypothetical protein
MRDTRESIPHFLEKMKNMERGRRWPHGCQSLNVLSILVFLGVSLGNGACWSENGGKKAIGGPLIMTQAREVEKVETEKAKATVIKALAQQLGKSEEEIQIESVAAHIWPDSSLACGEGENMNLQVMTPGYVIRLSVAGRIYEYHTNQSATIVMYCPKPREP